MSFEELPRVAEPAASTDEPPSHPAAPRASLLPFRRTQKCERRTELKYVITPEQADFVRGWARENLAADAWCDSDSGESYHVNSLYLDTPRLDIFHRDPASGKRKFRLRRYGSESTIWLESKKKRNKIVRKLRTSVAEVDLARLSHEGDGEWLGEWFRRCVLSRPLAPIAVVQYERFAWLGNLPDGRLRVTIDCNLRGQPARGWHVPVGEQGPLELLPGSMVLELKFRDVMPSLAKELFYALPLVPASFSKYRSAVSACGMVPSSSAASA